MSQVRNVKQRFFTKRVSLIMMSRYIETSFFSVVFTVKFITKLSLIFSVFLETNFRSTLSPPFTNPVEFL